MTRHEAQVKLIALMRRVLGVPAGQPIEKKQYPGDGVEAGV